jgi:AcrR family transcriptional regulator
VGLRELKKERTHRAIADAAFELFAARGFDHVTVAEVAEAAGVSEKTVFNYFRTKEDIFFDELPEREAALVNAICERDPAESLPAALRRLDDQIVSRMAGPRFATFARIIEESPALQVRELEIMAHLTNVLSEAIERELGAGELEARFAAALLVGVHAQVFMAARKYALAGRSGPAGARRLRADLARAYDLVEHGLGGLGARAS